MASKDDQYFVLHYNIFLQEKLPPHIKFVQVQKSKVRGHLEA